jgi:hypothetical protein
MPKIFSRPRFISHPAGVPFRSLPMRRVPRMGPVFLGTIPDPMIVGLVDEIIPGPAPTTYPWIILDPTSACFYVW